MAVPGPSGRTNDVSEPVRFGTFEADLRTGELRKNGRRIRLPHQSFAVLGMLLGRPGELITREELRGRLWSPDTTVEYEQGLNAAVNRLRDALGDSAAAPRFIETLPRRGYRFIGTIETAPRAPATAEVAASPPRLRGRGMLMRRAATWLAVAAVAAGFWLAARGGCVNKGNQATTGVPAPRPLTTLAGEEIAPSLSPDGSHVAFGWNGGAGGPGFDVYVKAVDSERVLRLTHTPARWVSPAWSPDGSRIAFTRVGEASSGIFILPALGGAERRLTDDTASTGPFAQVSWSPDGKHLAYSATDASGSHVVRVLALDDLTTETVSTGGCMDAGLPAFSADGRRLALVCTTSVAVYNVDVVDRSRRTSSRLASMMGYPAGLTWAADDRSVVVANDAGDGGRLWSLTPDGPTSRLPFGEDGSAPAVARSNGRMAYVRGWKNVDIWRVDLTAARLDQASTRVVASSRVDIMPRYSPDGARIAFQSNRTGAEEIWISNADGASPIRLTASNGPLVGAPAWCSDGRRVAYDSRATGTAAIHIATIGAGLPRILETTEQNLALPVWSGDCRWIIASNGRSALFSVPAEGGRAERFTRQPSYYAQVSGDRVIFNVKAPEGVTLWTRRIEGGEERPLDNMPRLRYDDGWVASSTGIYFITSATGRAALHVYDFATRTTRRLGWIARTPMPLGGLGLSVSPDERWLLLGLVDEAQSDLMWVDSISGPGARQ